MKEFYFTYGEKIQKEQYDLLKERDTKTQGIFYEFFKSPENFINGIKSAKHYDEFGNAKELNLDELKEQMILGYNQAKKMIQSNQRIPLFYCDKDYIAIELPNEYKYCKLSFINGLEGKLLRMETPTNLFDYSIDEFNKEPIKMNKKNGILIFK
jgi:hypothetical protein